VSLRKKFNSYKDFAGKSVEEVLGTEGLKKAGVLEVSELRSGFLENREGTYTFMPFAAEMQLAPIITLLRYDFNKDGEEEVLAAGNYFGVKPFHGRFGSFPGAVITNKNELVLGSKIGLDLSQKSARSLNIITLNNQPYLLVTFNNETAQVYKLVK
jgi:hypothetical protein